MMALKNGRTILEAAKTLASANREAEPTIVRTYHFPSETQIRLIHIDEEALPINEGEDILAFYFSPDPLNGINYPCAIALVRPGDERNHMPPTGWGNWSDASVLWES